MDRLRLRDLAVLTACGLLARIAAAAVVGYAPYTDPAYYTLVAERLATGHGFSVPVLWSFLEVGSRLPDPATLPVPSNAHWMPLTSIVSAGAMLLFGPSWRSGQLPMILLSTALVPLTYLVGRELWERRSVAILAAVLAIFAGPLLIYYPTVDNFAVFGVAGAGSLYAATRAMRSGRSGLWMVASAAAAGVATLARTDGLLVLVAPATAWLACRGIGPWRSVGRVGFGAALLAGVAYVAVLLPWLLRNLAVFGSPLPSVGGHVLWITSYNEQFSIGHSVGLDSYLSAGVPAIIGSKLESWFELLGRTGVLMGGTFLFTFLAGLWIHRRDPRQAPFLVYFVVMFAVMGGVFTFHAPRGAFYHSAPAWLPFALPMAVASIAPVCGALGRAWPFLRRPQTHRFVAVVGTVGAIVLSVVGSAAIHAEWERSHSLDAAAAGWLRGANQSRAMVMYSDPATLALLSGNPGVAPSFDPFPVLRTIARAYDVRWLVVQLRPGETTDALNLWPGAAARDRQGNVASWLAAQPSFEVQGALRIFAVHP